jgi:hypothetical protein
VTIIPPAGLSTTDYYAPVTQASLLNNRIVAVNTAGLYSVTYRAFTIPRWNTTAPKDYTINVELTIGSVITAIGGGGQPFQASPSKMSVTNGRASAAQTFTAPALGPSNVFEYAGVVGETSRFIVLPNDQYGNAITYNQFDIITFSVFVQLLTASNALINPYMKDNEDGTYSAYFAMDRVGVYNIWVSMCECDAVCTPDCFVRIGNSEQVEFELRPGPNFFGNFTAFGPGITEPVRVGQPAVFFVQPRDQYGNNRVDTGQLVSEIQNGISLITRTGTEVRYNSTATPFFVRWDAASALYAVDFTPAKSGTLVTTISISGEAILGGQGFSQIIQAGDPFAAYCEADGPGLRGAVLNDETFLYIFARDAAGNYLPSTIPNLFALYVVPQGTPRTSSSARLVKKVEPVDFDGTKYIAKFTPILWTGIKYKVDVYVTMRAAGTEELILNMPKTVEVSGAGDYGIVDPLQTLLSGNGLTEAVSGDESSFLATLQNVQGAFVPYTETTAASLNLGAFPYNPASTLTRSGILYGKIVRVGADPTDPTTDWASAWNLMCDAVGDNDPAGVLPGSFRCSYSPRPMGGISPSGDFLMYIYVRADAASQHVDLVPPFELMVVSSFTSAELSTVKFSADTIMQSQEAIDFMLAKNFPLDIAKLHTQAGQPISIMATLRDAFGGLQDYISIPVDSLRFNYRAGPNTEENPTIVRFVCGCDGTCDSGVSACGAIGHRNNFGFNVGIAPTIAGEYEVRVSVQDFTLWDGVSAEAPYYNMTLDGSFPSPDSYLTFVVLPTWEGPQVARILQDGISQAEVDQPARFDLVILDGFGNQWLTDPLVTIVGSLSPDPPEPNATAIPITFVWDDNVRGYVATYDMTLAGTYMATISVDGVAVDLAAQGYTVTTVQNLNPKP